MKFAPSVLVFISFMHFFCVPRPHGSNPVTAEPEGHIILLLGGNTWMRPAGSRVTVTSRGIENWRNHEQQFDTYLRVSRPGTLKLAFRAKTDGESQLQFSIEEQKRTIAVSGNDTALYNAGVWQLNDTGYVKITVTGLSKTGERFADIGEYMVSGTAINDRTAYVKTNDGNFFYWGRRGPSVHLSYPFADSIRAQWFYNEVTVPEGQDVIGSYFMANGFGEGYFGMQVNSPTERRILFSVWSPFSTDDPTQIPADQRIIMLKKGDEVYTGEFGNEGSGGQSFLRYPWKAGVTYRFLLKGVPNDKNETIYTAWFFAPEQNEWKLIASFQRPKTKKYLTRFHSFLENFIPEQGDRDRKVLFDNQWIADEKGHWMPLNKAVFTFDQTAAKGYRMDYAGGLENGQFFLRNCGFFSDYTPYRSVFTRTQKQQKPVIDLERLP